MKIYKTPTSFFGWRIVLNLLRWKAWTVNAFDITVNNAINGPLGIKALVKSKSFPRRYVNDILLSQTISNQIFAFLPSFFSTIINIICYF